MSDTLSRELLPILDELEQDELARCEAVIATGLRSFREMGEALLRVRDSRLYRAEFPTFEAYVEQRWPAIGTWRRAYQLMEAAEVVRNLNHGSDLPLPANERQARALAEVPEERRQEVWRAVVETAPLGKVTAARVAAAADAAVERAIQAVLDGDEAACRCALGERPALPARRQSCHAPAATPAPAVKPDPDHPWQKVTEIVEHLKALAQPPLTAGEFRRQTERTLMSPAREQVRALAPAVRAFLDAIARDSDS